MAARLQRRTLTAKLGPLGWKEALATATLGPALAKVGGQGGYAALRYPCRGGPALAVKLLQLNLNSSKNKVKDAMPDMLKTKKRQQLFVAA